jgi:hypothetical protein
MHRLATSVSDKLPSIVRYVGSNGQFCFNDPNHETGGETTQKHRPPAVDQVDIGITDTEETVTRTGVTDHIEQHGC